MRAFLCVIALGTLCLVAASADTAVYGRYVEARNCSVFAGPCHFNSEVTRLGQDATIVWHFDGGRWHGTDLKGLTVVAVISGERNLQDLGTAANVRHSVLYLDARADAGQRKALQNLMTTKFDGVLGQVSAIEVVPIRFRQDGIAYHITAGAMVRLDAEQTYCDHCTQKPYEVWYTPLAPGVKAMPAMTTLQWCRDSHLADQWNLSDESNSAFIGSFAVAAG